MDDYSSTPAAARGQDEISQLPGQPPAPPAPAGESAPAAPMIKGDCPRCNGTAIGVENTADESVCGLMLQCENCGFIWEAGTEADHLLMAATADAELKWEWEFSVAKHVFAGTVPEQKRIALSKGRNDCLLATGDSEGHVWLEISDSDADLIEAAPELLTACKAWLASFQDLVGSLDEGIPADPLMQMYRDHHGEKVALTRAAIAKAEGRAM